MSDSHAHSEPQGSDPSHDVDIGGRHAPGTSDDRLATTRLPALAPPPRPHRTGSTPPPPSVVVAGQSAMPMGAPAYMATGADGMGRPAMSSSVQARPAWWKTLLASSFPPPPALSPVVDRILEKRIGLASAALSLVLLVFALAVGLRGAPPLSARSPMVDAALVLARALMGLGLLGFGIALLGVGARFFLGGSRGDGSRSDSTPER